MDLQSINENLRSSSPEEIISWALSHSKRPVLTTNFRPYEVAILHAVSSLRPDLKVIWCDTGYNTPNTYQHARALQSRLNMNLQVYVPKHSKAYRDVLIGIPDVDTEAHRQFTEEVKLEPFRRAMAEHKPDLWFTNLRKGQTAFRNSIDILSQGEDGIIKVSPFYYWSDEELDKYLSERGLPNEFKYYDPTKMLSNRECGLHR